jgi:hypothetical protein
MERRGSRGQVKSFGLWSPAVGMERLHPPHDHLFEAGCDHSTSGAICAYYNSDRVIIQSDRSSDSPSIHYGLIASGKQVIRDGVARVRLCKGLNVLCFEMEAAGLTDNFPCVVIRGICDCPDSHKNKRWQPHTEATAAAYTKELLCAISGNQVDHTWTVDEMTAGRASNLFGRLRPRLWKSAEADFRVETFEGDPS